MPTLVKSALSPTRQKLIETMQRLAFGRLERIVVRASEPVLDPPPTIVREVKFASDNGPRDGRAIGDFALKAQAIEFFEELDRLGDGVIDVLTVRHGLPFSMALTATARA